MTARRCTGTTKRGNPCKAAPLRDRETCLAHADGPTRTSTGFGEGPRPGRPRAPRVVDVIRERIEADAEPVIGALWNGLTAERAVVVGSGEYATVEYVPDHDIRIKAARELLDRGYGRPVQALEHAGAGGGPIEHASLDLDPGDPEVQRLAHELLRRRAGR